MLPIDNYVFFVGWDSDKNQPVVAFIERGTDIWWHAETGEGHPFMWFDKRYGPMRKMEVTNRDGYGERIPDD